MNNRWSWIRYQWDRSLAIAAVVVGVIMLILGWVGISGARLTTQQLPYLASGAAGGLFALGVAATLWLSADMRDEFAKLDEIYRWMRDQAPPAEPVESEEEVASGERPVKTPTRSPRVQTVARGRAGTDRPPGPPRSRQVPTR